MFDVRYGSTRTVILTKNYAFKLPLFYTWKTFLTGLLSNMQEVSFSNVHEDLCPILFSLPGGFLVVMPRCEPLSLNDFVSIDMQEFVDRPDIRLPVEDKQDSFGWYQGRIVAVDYGS